jgi:hypothetical protein
LPRGEKLSPAQKRMVTKYKDVVTGKAQVLEPRAPKEYGKVFRTVGKKVIVPRGKGERWHVNKAGNMVRVRKGPRGEKISGITRRVKPGAEIPLPPPPSQPQPTGWSIPFARKLGKGQYKLEWVRFTSRDELDRFMKEYEKRQRGSYLDWANFVMEDYYEQAPDETHGAFRSRVSRGLTESAVAHGRASRGDFEPGPLKMRGVRKRGKR